MFIDTYTSYEASHYVLVCLRTGQIIENVEWADDETGEYCYIHWHDSRDFFIFKNTKRDYIKLMLWRQYDEYAKVPLLARAVAGHIQYWDKIHDNTLSSN